MVAANPQRHLIVAEGSGHLVAEDRPDMIVTGVERLLEMISR
jgi:hypothetical protein